MKRLISVLLAVCMLTALAVPSSAIAGTIKQLSVTGIVAPKPGEKPSQKGYAVVLDTELSGMQATVESIIWCDENDPELILGSNSLFQPGHGYEFYVEVSAPESYDWNTYDPSTGTFSEKPIMDVHLFDEEGGELAITSVSFFGNGNLIIRAYANCPDYDVDDVTIDALVPVQPKAGSRPNFEDYLVTQGASIVEVSWYDWTAGEYLSVEDKFVGGHEYQLIFHLKAGPGTDWLLAKGSSTADIRPGAVTVTLLEDTGKTVAVQSETDVNVQTGILSVAFKLKCEDLTVKLDKVTIGGLKYPEAGTSPQTSGFTLSIGKFLGFGWQDETVPGEKHFLTPGETFKAGHTYSIYFYVQAPDGCAWKAKEDDPKAADVDIQINLTNGDVVVGAHPPVITDLESAKGVLQVMGVIQLDAVVSDACKITRQPGDIYAKDGDTVVFSVQTEGGKDLKYQWHYGPEGGDSAPVLDNNSVFDQFRDAKSASLTIVKVTKAYSGWTFWCEISGEAGTKPVTTAKAKLTVKDETVTVPEEPQPKIVFKDVNEGDWFYDWVYSAVDLGLINGKGKDKDGKDFYDPAGNITYAETVKLAACMHQLYTAGEVTLKNGDPWYRTYADYCVENGILMPDAEHGGISIDNVLYNPNTPVTREQFAWIFSRALPKAALAVVNSVPDDSIPDVKRGGSVKYYDEIYTLYRAGILNGSDAKGTFNPALNIKRSEVAAITVRMMQPDKRVGPPAELGS